MAHATVGSSVETNKHDRKTTSENVACKSMDHNTSDTMQQPLPPDGGWGYVVVLASFLIHLITDGVTYSFGVFYLEFLYYFEEGKGATAWVASILVGVTLCSGPISGSFVNKFGCRSVTISGSLLASACLLASMWARHIVTLYFTIGIGTACGSGLGTLVFVPCLKYLIARYGWRGALMICSGIVLNCIVLGALFRPLKASKPQKRSSPEDSFTKSLQKDDTKLYAVSFQKLNNSVGIISTISQPALISKDVLHQENLEDIQKEIPNLVQRHNEEMVYIHESLKNLPSKMKYSNTNSKFKVYCKEKIGNLQEMLDISILKDPVYVLFTFSNFCTSIGFYVPYVYVLPQAEEQGINKNDASYLLIVIGIANTLGRIVLGYISDKPWVNRLLIYNLCLTICGISTILSTVCRSFETFILYSSIFGFTSGAYVGLTSVILVDLLDLTRLTNAFGLLLLFQGFASLLGPPIAGWLYDALESYNPGFFTAGGMITVSGLILFFIPLIQQKVQQNVNNKTMKNTTSNESV
ncbi:monocarboxylate transporter 5-like isoform X2 [Ptiloglossa arizonensis]|uniref:monocarboxylate transporter 5-like isoform X2 n=1 Tax=Ptiloglossa arizonensis TaxID=3350558 RepID=UPI003F9FC0E6